MTLGEMLDIAGQLASALSAAHEAGIVHRDIKPENIMLRPDGFVKVLDFGLAKLAPEERDIQSEPSTKPMVHTNPGVVMGTVSYMSPEQARAGDVDSRSDIWSLGVVMYEMVSGRTPFVGETSSHIIVAIIEHQPPPLSGIPITPVAYWRSKVNSQKNAAVTQTKLTPVRSVLVMPFENQSQNPDWDYLSHSIPDSMSVQAPGNKVIKLGGKPVDVQEEARALGVSAILTGRINKRENDIVLSVELIDARDKSRSWSQEYTRKFTRTVLIQLELAREISMRLQEMAFKDFYIIIRDWPTLPLPESK